MNPNSNLLRQALLANAVFSALSGAILLVASTRLGQLLGTSVSLAPLGAMLLIYAASLLWNARRENVSTVEAWIAVILDIAWVAGSAIVILTGVLSATGNWIVAIVADVVLLFAVLQFLGLRRLRGMTVASPGAHHQLLALIIPAVLCMIGVSSVRAKALPEQRRAVAGSNQISPDFPFTSRYIEIHGSKMHYVDEGSGDPILLIHGNPTSVYIWRNIIPHLTLLGRVIAVDLIGFGKSDKPDIEYRFADHVKYVEGFIEKLQLKNITLVLHDWGSALGFHYAARHETNVRGIAFMEALLAPLPKLETWPPEYQKLWRAFRTKDVGWDLIVNQNFFIEKRLPSEVIRKLTAEEMAHYREPFRNPASRKPLWRWPNELPIDGEPADVAKMQNEYVEKLKQSALPKLLLYAKPGSLMPEPVVEWTKKNFTNLKAVYVGEGLHNIQEDRPMEISAALAEWIYMNDLTSQSKTGDRAAKSGEKDPKPPGKLIDVGGHKLHFYCTGKSGPTVILDSGSGGWSVHWAGVQKELEKTTRVCSYDRAGLGWSQPGPQPRTAAQAADELNRLLSRSGEKGPFIIAGQSYGGYVARIFADRYPKMVAAVVLVESAHEKQWERLPGVQQMLEAGLKQFRDNVAKARAGQFKKEDFSNDGLPPDALPAYQISMLRPETHEAILAENESAMISAGQVATTKPLGEMPLVVLSAGNSFAWFIEPTEANKPMLETLNKLWLEMQAELARLSTKSTHIVSEKSTHGINREQPGVVADAIRKAIAAVRNR